MVGIRLELSGLGHRGTFVGVVRAQCLHGWRTTWKTWKAARLSSYFSGRWSGTTVEDTLWFRGDHTSL